MQGSSPSGTKQRIHVGLERRHHSLRTNQHSALLTAFLHKLLLVLWVSAQVWLPPGSFLRTQRPLWFPTEPCIHF